MISIKSRHCTYDLLSILFPSALEPVTQMISMVQPWDRLPSARRLRKVVNNMVDTGWITKFLMTCGSCRLRDPHHRHDPSESVPDVHRGSEVVLVSVLDGDPGPWSTVLSSVDKDKFAISHQRDSFDGVFHTLPAPGLSMASIRAWPG